MRHDLGQAARRLMRMPALSAVVVLSIAAGIGVNTVVFSWMQARLLTPVPGVTGGRHLLLIEPKTDAGMYPGASWPEYEDLRRSLRSFDGLVAARMTPLYVGEPGAVERLFGLLVSDNYFSALGVRPALGRFLVPEDAGGAPVAVISHRLWVTRFNAAPDTIGRTVRINARELTVIGVTPAEFQGTVVGLQFDAWLPATLAPLVAGGSEEIRNRSFRGYAVLGRLRPGVTRRQAQGEVDESMRQLARAHAATNARVTAEVLRFNDSPRGPQRMLNRALAMLQAIMLVLLLAVCGNVANLMLARASARQKEIGVRLALGADRWRIASLLLTENVLLALLGAGLGALFAVWATPGLVALPLSGLPVRFQTSVDGVGLAFAMLLGIASGAVFGAAPALHLARTGPQSAFRRGVASAGRSRLRHTLMAVQVGLAMIVLIATGFFLRSMEEARDTDPGFRMQGVLLAAYDLSGRQADPAFSRSLAVRTLDTLARLPNVAGAAIASSVPLDIHGMPIRTFTIEGRARADGGADEAVVNTVTPGYFGVMGIPLLGGRDFAPLTDTRAPREAIVNQAFVDRYIGAGEVLGRRINARGGPYTVTGVVGTTLYNAFGETPNPAIYFSYRDTPQPRGEIHVSLRGGSDAAAAADIRRAMRELDPDLPVFNLRSMTRHVDSNLILRKVPARILSVLGPMLLILAAIGIHAVVSYSVSLRTREVGVRIAVGATAGQVVRQFVGETLRVVALGGVLGWSLAFLLAVALAPRGIDPVVFTVVPALLLAVAGLASWIPASRAALIDPSAALRSN